MSKKRTVLGYIYRKSTENPKKALGFYNISDLPKTKKEALDEAKLDIKNGIIGNRATPKIVRVVLEEIE